MDFSIGIQDVGIAILQELWNKVALQSIKLVNETRDVVLEKDSFKKFSKSISELNILLESLSVEKVEAILGTEPTKSTIQTLNDQLKKACQIITDYKSGSCLHLFLHSHRVLSEMQDLSEKISKTISSLQVANLDISLNLKSKTEQIIGDLSSMDFRSAAAVETIASEIEQSITSNHRDRENNVNLLVKIAEAVGASPNASLVRNELELLKRQKEEMEAQKKQAEALQLSQLIQLLYSTEIVTHQQTDEESVATYQDQQYPYIDSFRCQLCNELMTDPVAILCGHSFEREAIQEYFERGEKACPTCGYELPSQLMTSNTCLRRSIDLWKQRHMDLKFQAAVTGIISSETEPCRQNMALEELLQILMEAPNCYAAKVAQRRLISKLVEFLKDNQVDTRKTLRCLYYLAKHCDEHKEAIMEARGVHRLVKQMYKGEAESDAMAVLVELSESEPIAEKIGNHKDCIPLLVSLVGNSNEELSAKAHMLLRNLSSNTHYVVKMAEAGYFQPFVACFNRGTIETRALMAAALLDMQFKESSIEELGDKLFIQNLVQMILSAVPAYRSACLHSIKKLIEHPKMVKRLLVEPATTPHLLGLVSFGTSQWKQEAAGILTTLLQLGASDGLSGLQDDDIMYPGLQELKSQHNVSLFLQTATTSSDSHAKVQFLQLLVVLSQKSETVRSLIRSDEDAVAYLYSSLYEEGENWLDVRQWSMRLIDCTMESHLTGGGFVPLPSTLPARETAINSLASILTNSPNIEERSMAAAIISRLPIDDDIIDEVLCTKSEAILKAIHEVIVHCSSNVFHDHQNPIGCTSASDDDNHRLLENVLGALLRYTEPTKPKLQQKVGKLIPYPSLVHVLSQSTGSSLAKQRTAIALAHLSQSTTTHSANYTNNIAIGVNGKLSKPSSKLSKFMFWCCSPSASTSLHDNQMLGVCPVHDATCLPNHVFCLIKADAVKPLVQTLMTSSSGLSLESAGVVEAALMALETLLIDQQQSTSSTHSRAAAAAIVDSQGLVAILQVLEKGSSSPSAKSKALDVFLKIFENTHNIPETLLNKSERILIQLLHDDQLLRKKAALVLRQMNIIPDQSSYF